MRTRIEVWPILIAALLVAGCTSSSGRDAVLAAPPATTVPVPTASPSPSTPDSAFAARNDLDAPAPLFSLEALAEQSDLIAFATPATLLYDPGPPAPRIVGMNVARVVKGEMTTSIALVFSGEVDLRTYEPLLVFAKRADESDVGFRVPSTIGPLFALAQGPASVLSVNRDRAGPRFGGFLALRNDEVASLDDTNPKPIPLPATFALADVLATAAASPLRGPGQPLPAVRTRAEPLPSAADVTWLRQLDAACLSARDASVKLTSALTAVYGAGTWSSPSAAEMLDLFDTTRHIDLERGAVAGLSTRMTHRRQNASRALDDARLTLVGAAVLSGADLKAALLRFGDQTRQFRDAWSVSEAPNCNFV